MFIIENLENTEKYEEENTVVYIPIFSDNNIFENVILVISSMKF